MSYCVSVLYLTCSKHQVLLGGKEGLASPAIDSPLLSLSLSSKKTNKQTKNPGVLKGFLSHYSKRRGLHSSEPSGNKSHKGRILCWLVFLSSVSGHVIPSHLASFPLYSTFFPVYWKFLSTPFFTAPFLVVQPQPPGNSSNNKFSFVFSAVVSLSTAVRITACHSSHGSITNIIQK